MIKCIGGGESEITRECSARGLFKFMVDLREILTRSPGGSAVDQQGNSCANTRRSIPSCWIHRAGTITSLHHKQVTHGKHAGPNLPKAPR